MNFHTFIKSLIAQYLFICTFSSIEEKTSHVNKVKFKCMMHMDKTQYWQLHVKLFSCGNFNKSLVISQFSLFFIFFYGDNVTLSNVQWRRVTVRISSILEQHLVFLSRGVWQLVYNSLIETGGLGIERHN